MNNKAYSNEHIEKAKSVSGCFSMFLLMVAITFIPALVKKHNDLITYETLLPLLYATEFIILIPLYFLFFKKRPGLGRGTFNVKLFFLLLSIIMLLQFVAPGLLGIKKAEEWMVSQVTLENHYFWLNNIMLIFIVPVYEEIVFRGCLFNTFKYWFNENVYLSAGLVSVLFSILHTQYSDMRTLFILFLISLVFIFAKVKSNGILMPVILHIMMNMVVIGVQYSLIG